LPALSPTAKQTRENIKDAFWRLYAQNPAQKLTVSGVCAVAGYNRSTFYTYFHDIRDVLDAIECELIPPAEYASVVLRDLSEGSDAQQTLRTLLALFEACDAYFSVLLSKDGDPAFRDKLLSTLLSALSQALPTGFSHACRYVLEYQNAGVILAIAPWYENGKDIPSERLVDLLLNLTRHGTQAVFVAIQGNLDQ